mmetsp:Transcript_48053/g.96949  ORF Transcript_48053/g.96949 Transcript_48053/m.96949 type:complete len:311 (+) Transcript_48053:119-1051(+)|eukprot:CAMPEP_0113818978 /NCGR_PEP_ID=MMETSP0328-20130328/510_1 /TAXON_ID=39455 /ORGANISM="Alexandrium minutum" /LENGTH=310 /DNA_ID=CAMNT_0000786913 /DNA_START=118 /DNA_END=1050 /DNA_ORIENTATION=+ /assembly_acc=CAM_ASM_000350
MEVRIHSLGGELCSVAVQPNWAWCDVKEAIKEATGIPSHEQRLFDGSEELSDVAAVAPHLARSNADCPPVHLTLVRRPPEQARWLVEVADSWFIDNPLSRAPDHIRADREVVVAALRRNVGALRYVDKTLLKDPEVILSAVRPTLTTLQLVVQYAARELWADRDFVVAAVQRNCSALPYASPELRADREVVRVACRGNPAEIRHAAVELLADRDFMLAVVEQDGNALRFAADSLKADRGVVLAAMSQNRQALNYASRELRLDQEMRMAAKSKSALSAPDLAFCVQEESAAFSSTCNVPVASVQTDGVTVA